MLRLQNPIYEVTEPGLHFKLPWPINSVMKLDKRWLQYDDNPREIITADKKTMIVDTYSYYRISDGILYIGRLQTQAGANSRTGEIVYSEMRRELGQKSFENILVAERNTVMQNVSDAVEGPMANLGLDSLMVRVSTTELPDQNKASVYQRMMSERAQQAKTYRSEGEQKAMEMRADTDKQVTIIKSEAEMNAQKLRGEGDNEAARIYNEAYGKNPAFFRLYRGLLAAENTLGGGNVKFYLKGDEPQFDALFRSGNK
ncbi:protease modulator HflC [bacterium]|nr:MAG: protease modulator HflC [bacterium]